MTDVESESFPTPYIQAREKCRRQYHSILPPRALIYMSPFILHQVRLLLYIIIGTIPRLRERERGKGTGITIREMTDREGERKKTKDDKQNRAPKRIETQRADSVLFGKCSKTDFPL